MMSLERDLRQGPAVGVGPPPSAPSARLSTKASQKGALRAQVAHPVGDAWIVRAQA